MESHGATTRIEYIQNIAAELGKTPEETRVHLDTISSEYGAYFRSNEFACEENPHTTCH
jgi:hypothetical protein